MDYKSFKVKDNSVLLRRIFCPPEKDSLSSSGGQNLKLAPVVIESHYLLFYRSLCPPQEDFKKASTSREAFSRACALILRLRLRANAWQKKQCLGLPP